LGGGGFGDVYEIDEQGSPKVLKVLRSDNPKALNLFQQEAKVLSKLTCTGIPKVDKDGYFAYTPKQSKESIYCLVMEKIEGLDLHSWLAIQNHQPITQELAFDWLNQLLRILAEVHLENYFHRDIKPSNIMIRNDGSLVLIDFGAVRELTATVMAGCINTAIFSPGYSPPEQQNGYSVPQSDFFALGRTFVYLLTGKEPSDPDIYIPSTNELLWRNYATHISIELADLIDNLMLSVASQRPKNAEVILARLRTLGSSATNLQSINTNKVYTKTLMAKTTNSQKTKFSPRLIVLLIFIVISTALITVVKFFSDSSKSFLVEDKIPLDTIKSNSQPELNLSSQPISSSQAVNYKLLTYLLSQREFIKADQETSRILLQITGNESNSYNNPVSASKIDCSVYRTIDQLWIEHSKVSSGQSKFGFNVQRNVWIMSGTNLVKFGERVGWRRNNDWLTFNDLNIDLVRNLAEVPEGFLPSKFRGTLANPTLSSGWMVWSLLPGNSAGACLSSLSNYPSRIETKSKSENPKMPIVIDQPPKVINNSQETNSQEPNLIKERNPNPNSPRPNNSLETPQNISPLEQIVESPKTKNSPKKVTPSTSESRQTVGRSLRVKRKSKDRYR